ncbi:hypothetical protein BPNPMPFG_002540 [Mesorhizobium sp. AR07]|uniref:hypothetical protein n=1 Tax=Mesorhizobium sp. AR07 TaxID=2865838 RepID=UPI00215FB28A|nr:hypothetical protein [Mesorhizobium sp. AR07]UVK46830.1 hypothetical protein BPNPMPFG_002540 [Mesorhizobium sp. AR07]
MIDDDFGDLLGDEPEALRPKRGRPTREEAAAKLEQQMANPLPHYTAFRRPVGITFFADILGVQPKQIQKRLEKCPAIAWRAHGNKQQPQYDFITGMSYLIAPQGSIEDWLAQQNQASLPPIVSKAYWEMTNARIRALTLAGQLWHDEDVLMTFARVSMLIRQESKMWIEDMPGRQQLTDEQYRFLVDRVNEMNTQIKLKLEDLPREFQTNAHSREVEKELAGTDTRPDLGDE